jgi:hypothetical protein
MSWSSAHKGVQIKPKLFINVTLYNELVEDSKKLNLLLKEKGTAVKAEAMGGDGDIPLPTAGALLVNDHAGPDGGVIIQKELAKPVGVSAAPSMDGQPGTNYSSSDSYCNQVHKSCPSSSSSAEGRHYEHQSSYQAKKRKIDDSSDNDPIPLIQGKPWYFMGPPARLRVASTSDSD